MPRFGLCCAFQTQPIKFGTTMVAAIRKLNRQTALRKLSKLCLDNAQALQLALSFCQKNGVGCFRVSSQILPLKTHPDCGYAISDLPDSEIIVRLFKSCGRFAKTHQLRTCFHPDQFVVLNSQRLEVVDASRRELEYQAEVAEWIGADVINIHGGGAFGNKARALETFALNFEGLSSRVKRRLTVENDDKLFTPADLLPLCRALAIPLVYDVHHHRCNSDGMSIGQATKQAIATWNREPLFHISSPASGWQSDRPERHHEFINVDDFPDQWRNKKITIEVETRAKEHAVCQLIRDLKANGRASKGRGVAGGQVTPENQD